MPDRKEMSDKNLRRALDDYIPFFSYENEETKQYIIDSIHAAIRKDLEEAENNLKNISTN